ncbi:MAG: HAD-IIA family hydrolase [Candidatus Helarchaeales archaeon]
MDFDEISVFIFDLDGVIYVGDQLIDGADELLEKLNQEKDRSIYFLTNNSTRTRQEYVKKLRAMGIKTSRERIMTSARATALYLSQVKGGSRVFVIGEQGLRQELEFEGFIVDMEHSTGSKVDFVVVGLDRDFNYEKLTIALHHLLNGADFIATNDDPSLPTEGLPLPGAGSMVSALMTCSGRKPSLVIGKPNPFGIKLILEMECCPPEKAVIVGDRVTTDILAGQRANIHAILVKTGAGREEVALKQSLEGIDLILESVKDMLSFF